MITWSSADNSVIAFLPPDEDMRTWEELGADGWGPEGTQPYFHQVLARVNIETIPPGKCLYHFGTVPFDINTAPLGYPTSDQAFWPNVMRAKSEGTVRLRSDDPADPPRIDFRYFTDPEGHDERVLVEGIKLARRIAEQPSLKDWIKRELAPGPSVQGEDELSEYARRTANTVYHPAGTCCPRRRLTLP